MAKTYKSGIRTTAEKRSPLAPTMAGGTPQGIYGGPVAPERGTLVRRKNTQAGEPGGGKKANRVQVYERQGARQRIEIPLRMPQVPEAAPTQANGRIIPSYPKMQDAWSGRQFWGGSQSGG